VAEPDAFHRALAALDVPQDETEVAEAVLAALRLGHDLHVHPRPERSRSRAVWKCSVCLDRVTWRPGAVDPVIGSHSTCAERIGRWADLDLASPAQLTWLAEHDRKASR
jgi:hypothetical protein